MDRKEIYAGVMLGFFAQVFYDLTRTLVSQFFPILSPYWQIALGTIAVVLFLKLYVGQNSTTR